MRDPQNHASYWASPLRSFPSERESRMTVTNESHEWETHKIRHSCSNSIRLCNSQASSESESRMRVTDKSHERESRIWVTNERLAKPGMLLGFATLNWPVNKCQTRYKHVHRTPSEILRVYFCKSATNYTRAKQAGKPCTEYKTHKFAGLFLQISPYLQTCQPNTCMDVIAVSDGVLADDVAFPAHKGAQYQNHYEYQEFGFRFSPAEQYRTRKIRNWDNATLAVRIILSPISSTLSPSNCFW